MIALIKRLIDYLIGTETVVSTTATKSFATEDDTTQDLTVFENTSSGNREVTGVFINLQLATTGFDAVHTAGDTITIKVWKKIGTNYTRLDSAIFTAGSITNHPVAVNLSSAKDFKITANVSTDRGAYDLPYEYNYKVKL